MVNKYQQTAAASAKHYGIPPRIFHALITKESGWRPDAISPVGAIGLTQLMPGTAKGLGVNPHDPIQNIEGGARYLSQAYKHFGNWHDALRAYNQGWGGAASNPEHGKAYADSILGHAKTVNLPMFGIGRQPKRPSNSSNAGRMLASAFADDPAFAHLMKVVNVPDHVVQSAGIVDPGGSVRHVPLPTGPVKGVVAAAQNELGLPYRFGTESEGKSFDCSGLIQYAYSQMGIHLPRTTFEQVHAGQAVTDGRYQPGDLIFPSPHHVVMYVGHGKVIAAPHTGTVVQYQDVPTNIYAARRVM